MKKENYYYRGSIERPKNGSYKWTAGYSRNGPNGGVLYPWLTIKEAIKESKEQNLYPVFVSDEQEKKK